MNKIIRYWNQNREKIIIVIAIIAFIIILIQIVNNLLKNTTTNNEKNNTNTSKVQDVTKPSESYMTGQKVNETTTKQNTEIIKNFVEYCNNNQTTQVYELLSDDCKNEFQNDVNSFINNYQSKIFRTKKAYNLEFVLSETNSYTYKITYYEDNLLATGGNTTSNNYEDYISIINQNGESRISISSFIKKVDINKNKISNNIEIIVNSKKVYRSYETYNITIKNKTLNTIKLSDGQNSKDICLIDKNDVQYSSFINEIPTHMLELEAGKQITLNIKFNKMYDIYRSIEELQFSNINLGEESNIKILVDI